LHVLRVLAGLLFLGWLLGFAGYQQDLFGVDGWFDAQAYREAGRLSVNTPAPVSWSLLYLCGHNAALLHAIYWGGVGVLVLFTLGVATRITSVLTWVVVASFLANPATSFDADYLLNVIAFYLMIGYLLLGQWSGHLSPRQRLFGAWRSTRPSRAAGLTLRLLQVHFAIVMVVSGLHKLQFGDWWAGVAYWYPLNPPFEVTRESLRAQAPHAQDTLALLSLLQYVALAWQLTFPLFAWRQRWKFVLLAGGVAGWLGSVVIYRQPLFGPILLLACLCYLRPEDWRRLGALKTRLVGLLQSRRQVSSSAPVQGGPVHV
jgi:hypothetical protein